MEKPTGLTICIGDIHGHIEKLKKLWVNLEATVGTVAFLQSTIIFLGDYNDRGPDAKSVLDFLTALPERYPSQRHVFLAGNHDFAFMACLELLPPPPPGFSMAETWATYSQNEEHEGWWKGPGQENVHVQGRRWAGDMKGGLNAVKGVPYQGSNYDAAPTFNSYGVAHGDRQGLIAAVPERHKEFLRNLVWVHEQDGVDTGDPETSYSKLVAVHAGLEKRKPIASQLQKLYEKDATVPRVEAFHGRHSVWDTPQELVDKKVLVVSGHHAAVRVDKLRLIIDEGGGMVENPIAAIILPSRVIVRNTDAVPGVTITEPHALPALVASR